MDLADALRDMSDDLFSHHVNDARNDFANWVHHVFEEPDLDAVTALSGSGPAYVFFLAESMIHAGVKLGLTPENARDLTVGTLKGAVAMMETGKEPPEALRRKVTSPGGTTEAAFKVLDGHNARQLVIDAITAAAERSRELSR